MLSQATYEVQIAERGGSPVLGVLPHDRLSYGYGLDEVTFAEVSVPASSCPDFVGTISSWEHELLIWREGEEEEVWLGPVTEPTFTRERITIRARDLAVWFDHRFIHGTYDPITADLVGIFLTFAADALLPDNSPGIIFNQQSLSGIIEERRVLASEHRVAGDEMRDLARERLDFTMRGRTLHVGGTINDRILGILDDNSAENPELRELGLEAANRWVTLGYPGGAGQLATFGADTAQVIGNSSSSSAKGLLEHAAREKLRIRNASAAQAAAEEALRAAPEVLSVDLKPEASFSFADLVPGARIDVRVSATRDVVGEFRIGGVRVSQTIGELGETETVSLALERSQP